jgi:UDP-N-acetyl-D-mannosaminuronate dehydrogenase
VYELVVKAGVHRAASIKVAESAKIIENTQRDVNIALINELSIIFNRLGINTYDVLEAAGTKWNFLKFQPVWLVDTALVLTLITLLTKQNNWVTTRKLSILVVT